MSAGERGFIKITYVNSEPGPGAPGSRPDFIAAFLVSRSLLQQQWALLETVEGSGRFHSSLHEMQGTAS